MNIPKIALRLDNFKSLLAVATLIGLVVLPSIVMFGFVEKETIRALHPVLKVPLVGSWIVFQIGLIVSVIINTTEKEILVKPLSYHYWKSKLNWPLKYLHRKEIEKSLLVLRHLNASKLVPSELQEEQKRVIAQNYVKYTVEALEYEAWAENIDKSSNPIKEQDFEAYTRHKALKNKLNAFMKIPELSILLEPLIKKEVQCLSATQKINLNLPEWGNEDRLLASTFGDEPVGAQYEKRAAFLLDNGYTLSNQDYKDLLVRFKKEEKNFLTYFLDLLKNYPQAANWLRLQEFLTHYKRDDSFFEKYQRLINDQVVITTSEDQQTAIITTIEQKTVSSVSNPQSVNLATSGRETEAKQEAKIEKEITQTQRTLEQYVSYKPLHFVEKWAEIFEGYRLIQEHSATLSKFEFLEIMVNLESALSVMIISDKTVDRLPKAPQNYQEKAKDLLSQNLDLCAAQLLDYQAQIGEQHLKKLEVHKHYQTAKMSR